LNLLEAGRMMIIRYPRSFADTYYEAGKRNLPAIERIVVGQY
jgi:hypothetical protein